MSRVVIHDDLLRPDAPETARHLDNVISFTVIVMFVLAIPVAFFFTVWTFILWAVLPLLIRAIKWRRAGGTPRQLLTRPSDLWRRHP
jgi:1,4-dihydroxy-2-naphthoate octaprenyltransferase